MNDGHTIFRTVCGNNARYGAFLAVGILIGVAASRSRLFDGGDAHATQALALQGASDGVMVRRGELVQLFNALPTPELAASYNHDSDQAARVEIPASVLDEFTARGLAVTKYTDSASRLSKRGKQYASSENLEVAGSGLAIDVGACMRWFSESTCLQMQSDTNRGGCRWRDSICHQQSGQRVCSTKGVCIDP